MTKKFTVEVRQIVDVELDESKFDEAFLAEFRESFYQFDTLADHAEHIAQLEARGVTSLEFSPEFIEGYGPSEDMGIKATVRAGETEIEILRMPEVERAA